MGSQSDAFIEGAGLFATVYSSALLESTKKPSGDEQG